MLGTSDAWSTSHLSQQTSEPAYYTVDCRIFCNPPVNVFKRLNEVFAQFVLEKDSSLMMSRLKLLQSRLADIATGFSTV